MCTAIFLITHKGIASNMLAIAESILKQKADNVGYYEVAMDDSVLDTMKQIEQRLNPLDCESLIFITDIYGSTPSNIAQQLAEKLDAHLVSGINLPMILRLLNYREEDESELLHKALDGARNGITQVR
jgi:PTS system ascorbate-specific IIA component